MSLRTNLIKLVPPTLRRGFCPKPATWQQLANDIIGGTQAVLLLDTGSFLYNYGASTPAAENRVFPWLNTTDGRWYTFQSGLWTSPYAPAAGPNGLRWIWTGENNGAAGGLWRFDGGDGSDPSTSPPTSVSGSFWEVDSVFEGRAPFGVGPVPGTTNPALTLALGSNGGEGQHQLIAAEIPKIAAPVLKVKGGQADNLDADNTQVLVNPAEAPAGFGDVNLTIGNDFGEDKPHNNMPPYVPVYFIKRTTRAYYAIPA